MDRSIVYSSGMSLKDIGKIFSYINREQEEIFVQELLKKINDMLQTVVNLEIILLGNIIL